MPVAALPRIWPLYFGERDQPLFGCYLEPSSRRRQCAVVVCQPMGHEYINSHRALRQMASRLSEEGFPVLRFDFYGCGDSSGNCEEGSVQQWLKDVSTAMDEIRQRTGLSQICLVGLRMGAALAALTAIERRDVESLVLWDPVVSGKSYLNELRSVQREMMRFRPRPRCRESNHAALDILGFPVSRSLYSELEQIQMPAAAWFSAKNVLIIESRQSPAESSWHERFRLNGGRLQVRRMEAPEVWLPREDGSLLVPGQVLQSIVSWACGVHR